MIRLNFRRGSAFASKKAKSYLEIISPEDIKNITVIRHAAIGDFMNIRPFLIHLRKFFPNAKITLSVLKNMMYGIPYDLIDDIHIMHKIDPNNSTKKTSLFRRIKDAKTLPPQDIIFDLTDSALTLLLVNVAKSKLKIGYSYRWVRRIFYDISTLRSDFVIEAHSVIHMLNILGYKDTTLNYGFENIYPKDSIKNRIIYFAGASTANKCWEREKFVQLIDRMHKKYSNYEHIILQGIKDDEKFLDIYNNFKDAENVKLQEAMDLDKTMHFLANSKLVICNDTGIRNMAIATQTPTVGIFFATGAFRYWPRDGLHECVFNLSYSSPSVDDVYTSTVQHMDRLYES